MRAVQATEARARLSELLRTVERGETIAITRHDKAVAHLVPAEEQEHTWRKETVDVRRLLERIRLRHKTLGPVDLSEDTLREMRNAGRP